MQGRQVKRLTSDLLASLSEAARGAPSRRRHHRLHDDDGELVQRTVIVLSPDTYLRPHRHAGAVPHRGFELLVVLQGQIGILLFDGQGNITEATRVGVDQPVRALEIPPGTFHTIVVLEEDTAVLEVKQGPYDAASDKELLPGFPEESDVTAARAELARWRLRLT